MKSIAIVIVILALAAAGWTLQRSKLNDLETQTTARLKAVPEFWPANAKVSVDPKSPGSQVSGEEKERLREDIAAAIGAFREGTGRGRPDPDSRRRMLLTAAKFSAGDIEQLLMDLGTDSRLAGSDRNEILEALLEIFSSTAPAATLDFLKAHRDLPHWADYYARSFNDFLTANPREAIRWYDEQAALGNPDVAVSSMRSAILIRESRIDPDRMLDRALSPDFASDSGALYRMGGAVASTLSQASEHRQFLAALRRARDKSGESPVLAKIRAEYIGGFSNELAGFPFADASSIVDTEFTADEKLDFFSGVSHRGDLAEPAKWADWFLAVDFEAWKRREVSKGESPGHPATALLENWAASDWQAAGKWLEKVPPGPLRSDLVLNYSWRIAAINPDNAATYLAEIPDGKGRRNLVGKIAKTLDSKDPEAAAEFRAAHPASR